MTRVCKGTEDSECARVQEEEALRVETERHSINAEPGTLPLKPRPTEADREGASQDTGALP